MYLPSVALTCLSCVLEMISEPAYARLLHYQSRAPAEETRSQAVNIRVRIESAVTIARCISTFAIVHIVSYAHLDQRLHLPLESLWLPCFALAQMLSSVVHSALVVRSVSRFEVQHLKTIPAQSSVDSQGSLQYDTMQFTLLSVLKLVLDEGGKMVLIALQVSASVSGSISLVRNLGSLVARVLLQPVEEAAFYSFGRSVANDSNRSIRKQLASYLLRLLKFLLLLSLLWCTVLPVFSRSILIILYGARYEQMQPAETSTAQALGVYSLTLTTMAVNGVTEAFVQAQHHKLSQYQMICMTFSIIFIASNIWAARLTAYMSHEMALSLASIASFCIRILYNIWFIHRWSFGEIRWIEMLPSIRLCAMVGAAAIVAQYLTQLLALQTFDVFPVKTSASWTLTVRLLMHVATGASLLAVWLVGVFLTERTFVHNARSLLRKRSD